MGLVSTLLLLYARIWLINDNLLPIYFETHGNKAWVYELSQETNKIPVVFQNSYRNASMYSFYSGNASFSLNTTARRQNQFTIDDSESKIQGKRIAYIAKKLQEADFEYSKKNGTTYKGKYIDSFKSHRKLWCFTNSSDLNPEQLHDLKIGIYNPYKENIPVRNIELYVAYLNEYKEYITLENIECSDLQDISPYLTAQDTLYIRCTIPAPEDENVHYIRFGIAENGLKAGINSKFLKLNK